MTLTSAEKAKRYRLRYPDKVRAATMRYRNEHRDKLREYAKRRYQKIRNDPVKVALNREQSRRYYRKNPEEQRIRGRARTIRLRQQVLSTYGAFCHCPHRGGHCGVAVPEFLSIDHIDPYFRYPDEPELTRLYGWLVKKGFPQDNFRILCYNCNFSRRRGKCVLST